MSWQEVSLGGVSKINPRLKTKPVSDKFFDFLPMAGMSEEGKTVVKEQRPYAEVSKGFTAFRKKDVLLAKITPCFENNKVGVANIQTELGFGSTEFHVIRPDVDRLDENYLGYFLRTHQVNLAGRNRMTGSGGQRRVPKDFLEKLKIPLPPLAEQKRIAAILDQADALRQKRKAALDHLSQLGQSIFYEMFGDPTTNPKHWPQGIIRDFLAEAKYGTSKKANTSGKGMPVLRMGNITYDGHIDLSDLKYVEFSKEEFPKYTTKAGDILFNRTNSKELVGKTAVVRQSKPLAIAGYLVRARTNSNANPHYISGYLNSPHGKLTLAKMCNNIVGMANINAQKFQDIKILMPPSDLQNEYANKLDEIELWKSKTVLAVKGLNTLFASLQQRAFRGDL